MKLISKIVSRLSALLKGQVRGWAIASLASEVLIVVTGGVVRLTGSGLGCTDWPECTAGHFTTTPAQGYHGLIEFANRTLSGALILIAIATLLSVRAASLRSATRVSWALIVGILVQAVVGGVTVWIKLVPWLVGVHFVLSAVMIALAARLVWLVFSPQHRTMPLMAYRLANPLVILGGITVFLGVLTTGAGPHAGDAQSVRNGLSFDALEKWHSLPAYLLLGVEIWLFVVLLRHDLRKLPRDTRLATKVIGTLLGATVLQAILGVAQVQLLVPAVLVAIHMFGAATLIALLTFSWHAIKGRNREVAGSSTIDVATDDATSNLK